MTAERGPLGLDAIGQIHINVDDIDRAVAFYRDVLGMRFLFRVPGQSMAFFDCGGVRLYLGKAESPEFRSSPLIYYRVDGLEAACAALRAHGVTITEEPHLVDETETGQLWMAGFRDSEANHVVLMEELHTG